MLPHDAQRAGVVPSEAPLFTRGQELVTLPLLREPDIGFVAYSPLGRGMLTGAIRSREDLAADDSRHDNPRFSEENFDHNLRLVEQVETIAREADATPAQVALAWLLAQGNDIAPIPAPAGSRALRRTSPPTPSS